MQKEHLIPADKLCIHQHIELSFIHSLKEYGLIEIVTMEEEEFIPEEQLEALEKFARLHYDLDINLEGIDAIIHLLQKVNGMQEEITSLQNRLRRYGEPGE